MELAKHHPATALRGRVRDDYPFFDNINGLQEQKSPTSRTMNLIYSMESTRLEAVHGYLSSAGVE